MVCYHNNCNVIIPTHLGPNWVYITAIYDCTQSRILKLKRPLAYYQLLSSWHCSWWDEIDFLLWRHLISETIISSHFEGVLIFQHVTKFEYSTSVNILWRFCPPMGQCFKDDPVYRSLYIPWDQGVLTKLAGDLLLSICFDTSQVGCWIDIDISPIPHRISK